MVDASWRWSFSEAALGKGNQAYLRFWKNALRWLVADPDDRRVVLAPDRDNVLLGDEVQVRVNVRDAGHLPLADTLVRIATTGPDGEASSQELTTDASGEAVVAVRPTVTGAHQVDAVLVNDPAQKSTTVFAVSDRDPELDEVIPDDRFLESLVALYEENGRLVSPDDPVSLLLDNTAVRSVRQRRESELATAPLVAIWVASFACGAWWLRRRRGAV